MNTLPNVAQSEPGQTWQGMADEMAALELLEAQDRIRDVEAERDSYRDQLRAMLDVSHTLITDRDRLRGRVREQARIIRELRASLVIDHKRSERRAA